jgi:hypothetical protein
MDEAVLASLHRRESNVEAAKVNIESTLAQSLPDSGPLSSSGLLKRPESL